MYNIFKMKSIKINSNHFMTLSVFKVFFIKETHIFLFKATEQFYSRKFLTFSTSFSLLTKSILAPSLGISKICTYTYIPKDIHINIVYIYYFLCVYNINKNEKLSLVGKKLATFINWIPKNKRFFYICL